MTTGELSPASARRQLTEATLAIYTSITLLGVIAAASWKGLFVDEPELLVLIIGTSVTLAVAHGWASIAAHRFVHRTRLSRLEKRQELRGTAVILVVGAAATATFVISTLATDTLDTSVRLTLGVLVAVLFVVGVAGSRRRNDSWPRALGWGLADASIGIVALVLKIILGS